MAKVRKLLTQIYLNIANTCDVVSFHSLAIHVFMIWSISCTEGIHVRAFALRQDLTLKVFTYSAGTYKPCNVRIKISQYPN